MREWTQQIDYNLLHDPGRQTPIPVTESKLFSSAATVKVPREIEVAGKSFAAATSPAPRA